MVHNVSFSIFVFSNGFRLFPTMRKNSLWIYRKNYLAILIYYRNCSICINFFSTVISVSSIVIKFRRHYEHRVFCKVQPQRIQKADLFCYIWWKSSLSPKLSLASANRTCHLLVIALNDSMILECFDLSFGQKYYDNVICIKIKIP